MIRWSPVSPGETDGISSPGPLVPEGSTAPAFAVSSLPVALVLGPTAFSGATPYGGGARAHVAPEPELDEVNAPSSALEVIYVFSGLPSPSKLLAPSSPSSWQKIADTDYDERRRIYKRALVRQ